MNKPTGAERTTLVQDYARRIFSVDRAPLPAQQRLYKKFEKTLDRLASKYPQYDWSSDAFFAALQDQATEWWQSRAVKGSGSDW